MSSDNTEVREVYERWRGYERDEWWAACRDTENYWSARSGDASNAAARARKAEAERDAALAQLAEVEKLLLPLTKGERMHPERVEGRMLTVREVRSALSSVPVPPEHQETP